MVNVSKVVLGLISIVLAVGAFLGTQKATSKHMEPIVAACSTLSPDGFAKEGQYHPYEAKLGGTFVCLITQFIHDLVKIQPVGFITWGSTMLTAIPAVILMSTEPGRQGAKGLITYPTLLGLVAQLLGISVMFPALWVPACIYGGSTNGTIGTVRPIRVYMSTLLVLPTVIATILLFTLNPASYEWTLTAGILGGPAIVLLNLLLWPLSTPKESKPEDVAKGCFALANLHMLGSILGFFGWVVIVFAAINGYGTNHTALWNDLWVQAHPSVAFMTIDAVVLFLGMVVYLLSISIIDGLLAVILCPMLGPGAASSIILSRIELRRGEEATNMITKKTKGD